MRLVFLGTGAARPSAGRGMPCVCLDAGAEVLLFDAGEGAQGAYARAGLRWNRRMRIFVTHMHGDHCLGIHGLLQTMSLQGRTEPVSVYGPPGIEEYVVENARMLGFSPRFPLSVAECGPGRVARGAGYSVSACEADHGVYALSYLFEADARPGRFSEEAALRLGVPRGPAWGELQRGGAVEAGGRRVLPSEVLGGGRPGARVGVSGDTRPAARLAEFFRGCDPLVFDSTFGSEHAALAEETGHSTAAGAGALAAAAGAGRLVLTHFSSRYADVSGLVAEARGEHGPVVAAADGMEVAV